MRVNHKLLLTAGAVLAAGLPGAVLAQDIGPAEVRSRYDEALQLTLDPTVIAADNTRYIWATQAKVQCGIAIGFFKSGYADPVSIGKCDAAWQRMRGIVATPVPVYEAPPPPPPPPVPPPPPPPPLQMGERG
jgi:OOP family OmpA-OmpF porin